MKRLTNPALLGLMIILFAATLGVIGGLIAGYSEINNDVDYNIEINGLKEDAELDYDLYIYHWYNGDIIYFKSFYSVNLKSIN